MPSRYYEITVAPGQAPWDALQVAGIPVPIRAAAPGPAHPVPALAPAAPLGNAARAAILACPHAGPTPERFGRSCACDRLCRLSAVPRVVVFRDCRSCPAIPPPRGDDG